MKRTVLTALICLALLAAGCGSSAQAPAGSDKEYAKELEASAQADASGEDSADAAETADKTGTDPAAADSAAEADETAAAETLAEETPAEETPAAETAAAEAVIDGTASGESMSGENAVDKSPSGSAAEKSTAGEGDAEEAPEKDGYEDEYVPEGFVPSGNYLLVYDSGYEVKSRYSGAGLTFYMESEEFQFILDKNLPHFKEKVAHMLFNTAAPMDPAEADAAGETFPFEENYVLYIDLDDGSSYQVFKDQLDLKGRIFVRDLYESFREKWEGAF